MIEWSPAVQALIDNPHTFTLALDRAVSMRGPAAHYIRKNNGDYSGCFYRDPDGMPGCIIGLALHLCGIDYNPKWEDEPARRVLDSFLGLPTVFADAAQRAQVAQDNGEAYNVALSEYRQGLVDGDEDQWGHKGNKPWEVSSG